MRLHSFRFLRSFHIYLVLSIPLLFSSCNKDENPAAPQVDNSVAIALFEHVADSICKDLAYPNLVFGVWIPGKNLSWIKNSTGSKYKTKVAVSDLFCVESITKTFTAVLAMQLVEKGKIRLSDNLDSLLWKSTIDTLRYVNSSFRPGKITLKMLLNHTSALPDFSEDSSLIFDRISQNPAKFWDSLEITMLAFNNYKIDTTLIGTYSYSNTNYILLGMIIEKASGKKYNELLKENIFIPCGMNTSFLSGYDKSNAQIAPGYFMDGTDISYMNFSWDWSCGGIMSNVGELYSFFNALNSGRLLSASSLEEMLFFNIYYKDSQLSSGVGMGLSYYGWLGVSSYGHSGATLNYSSVMYYVPEKKAYLIGYTNEYGNVLPDTLMRALFMVLP